MNDNVHYPIAQRGMGSSFERVVKIDWILLGATIVIVIVGNLMVHSTEVGSSSAYVLRQMVASLIGLMGLIFFAVLPYQIFRTYVKPIYLFMLIVLVLVLVVGENLRGTKGWFRLGPVYLQASEIARLTFVLSLAGYLDRRIQWFSPKSLIVPFTLAMIPIGLILIQPDLSSSLVFFPMTLLMFYLAGARTLHLLSICLVGGLAAGIPLLSTYFDLMSETVKNHIVLGYLAKSLKSGWEGFYLFSGVCLFLTGFWWFLREMRIYIPSTYLWVTLFLIGLGTAGALVSDKALKQYQRKRLVAFINPDIDPLGSGYNVKQSQIAVGSGRVLGKGYRKGTQSRLGFLPSRHTDFIFSVVGEEFGFIRSLLVCGFYFLIAWRGFEIALLSRDRFGSLVAAGFGAQFAFYFILNLGMTMGMAPVAGVPLPLVSYGGSSMVSSLVAIGILLSIHWRRHLL